MSTLKKFIAAIRAHIEFRIIFCNFIYQFWVSIVVEHVTAKPMTIMGALLHWT